VRSAFASKQEENMLNNPATADDVKDIIDWLEARPASVTFDYQSRRYCLLAQYLTDRGFTDVRLSIDKFYSDQGNGFLPKVIKRIAAGGHDPNVSCVQIVYGKTALEYAREQHSQMLYGIQPSEDAAAGV
jgi:hypothetical protein